MISEHVIMEIGRYLLTDPTVVSTVTTLASNGINAIVVFITPLIVPAMQVLGIVLIGVAIGVIAYYVAEYLYNKFKPA